MSDHQSEGIEFGTPEAEFLGTLAFSGKPRTTDPSVKAALLARIEASTHANGTGGTASVPSKPAGADGPEAGASGGEDARQAEAADATVGSREGTDPVLRPAPGPGRENGESTVARLPTPPRRRTWMRTITAVAASAALLVAGFAGGRAWTAREMADEVRFNDLNHASDYRAMAHEMPDGSAIRVVWSHEEHSAALVMPDRLAVPEGKAVQAWLVKGERMTSVGMYHADGKEPYTFLSAMPDDGESVMLTIEPESGSDSPSADTLAEFDMGGAKDR